PDGGALSVRSGGERSWCTAARTIGLRDGVCEPCDEPAAPIATASVARRLRTSAAATRRRDDLLRMSWTSLRPADTSGSPFLGLTAGRTIGRRRPNSSPVQGASFKNDAN